MDIDIDFEVFAYGDETNRGRATSIAQAATSESTAKAAVRIT